MQTRSTAILRLADFQLGVSMVPLEAPGVFSQARGQTRRALVCRKAFTFMFEVIQSESIQITRRRQNAWNI